MNANNQITISLPLPNVGVNEKTLAEAVADLEKSGASFELKGITPYPVSASWVEIGFNVALFLGGAAASHYADKLFDMIDSSAKQGIDSFNAIFKRGTKESGCDFPRDNKAEAVKLITQALEMLKDDDQDSADDKTA